MSRINLPENRPGAIFDMMKQIIGNQGFTFSDDLSGTEVGPSNHVFRLIPQDAEISDRSRGPGILQPRQTYLVELLFNAENSTEEGLKTAQRAVSEVAHALDRFAPDAPLDTLRSQYVCGTFIVGWTFETLVAQEDTRLKATIEFDVEYRIPRE